MNGEELVRARAGMKGEFDGRRLLLCCENFHHIQYVYLYCKNEKVSYLCFDSFCQNLHIKIMLARRINSRFTDCEQKCNIIVFTVISFSVYRRAKQHWTMQMIEAMTTLRD